MNNVDKLIEMVVKIDWTYIVISFLGILGTYYSSLKSQQLASKNAIELFDKQIEQEEKKKAEAALVKLSKIRNPIYEKIMEITNIPSECELPIINLRELIAMTCKGWPSEQIVTENDVIRFVQEYDQYYWSLKEESHNEKFNFSLFDSNISSVLVNELSRISERYYDRYNLFANKAEKILKKLRDLASEQNYFIYVEDEIKEDIDLIISLDYHFFSILVYSGNLITKPYSENKYFSLYDMSHSISELRRTIRNKILDSK